MVTNCRMGAGVGGIEKADDPYEWAIYQLKNCPRMPKNKEGKQGN